MSHFLELFIALYIYVGYVKPDVGFLQYLNPCNVVNMNKVKSSFHENYNANDQSKCEEWTAILHEFQAVQNKPEESTITKLWDFVTKNRGKACKALAKKVNAKMIGNSVRRVRLPVFYQSGKEAVEKDVIPCLLRFKHERKPYYVQLGFILGYAIEYSGKEMAYHYHIFIVRRVECENPEEDYFVLEDRVIFFCFPGDFWTNHRKPYQIVDADVFFTEKYQREQEEGLKQFDEKQHKSWKRKMVAVFQQMIPLPLPQRMIYPTYDPRKWPKESQNTSDTRRNKHQGERSESSRSNRNNSSQRRPSSSNDFAMMNKEEPPLGNLYPVSDNNEIGRPSSRNSRGRYPSEGSSSSQKIDGRPSSNSRGKPSPGSVGGSSQGSVTMPMPTSSSGGKPSSGSVGGSSQGSMKMPMPTSSSGGRPPSSSQKQAARYSATQTSSGYANQSQRGSSRKEGGSTATNPNNSNKNGMKPSGSKRQG